MFYLNTKYRFPLPEHSDGVAGGIIAASAMPLGQLLRREFRDHAYLQHRFLDPQLYLAGLDPNVAKNTVLKLATYPWFAKHDVPEYDSSKHKSIQKWKLEHGKALTNAWLRRALTNPADVATAARAAVELQVNIGCNGIILPTPLTTIATKQFAAEAEWIDAGIAACRELRVTLPIYATVALQDNVLRGVDAHESPLVHSITNQIAARSELAGAYVVVELTSSSDHYVCKQRDVLSALLVITDDLARGAARQVIVNYAGTFGAVLAGAGAYVWSSGYYLSQRRLQLSSFESKGLAKPRYYSHALAGDVGIETDLPWLQRHKLATKIFSTSTVAGDVLKEAITSGKTAKAVPEWQFRTNNITAAASHYTQAVSTFGAKLRSLDQSSRVGTIEKWLTGAVNLVEAVESAGFPRSPYTELEHQRVWLDVFNEWKRRAGK